MLKSTLLATALLFSGAAYANDLQDLNTLVDQTNVVVNTGCSGTLIDKEEALILTANHCVDQQYKTVEREEVDSDGEIKKKEVRVTVPGSIRQLYFNDEGVEIKEVSYRMEVVGRDQGTDLAVVKAMDKLPSSRVAKIACNAPLRGDDVYIVGNPYGLLYSSLVKGNVAGTDRTYATVGLENNITANRDNGLTQIAGGVVGGNSGGAVYNSDNELVGVPVLAYVQHENNAFAVPLQDIQEFLKKKLTSIPMKKAYNRIMGHCVD